MIWPFKRKPKTYTPNLEAFHAELARSVNIHNLDGEDVAKLFRRLFVNLDPVLGRQVLFILLTWCEEYRASTGPDDPVPPIDGDQLQRWAGKREIAARIKAALNADLSAPGQ